MPKMSHPDVLIIGRFVHWCVTEVKGHIQLYIHIHTCAKHMTERDSNREKQREIDPMSVHVRRTVEM